MMFQSLQSLLAGGSLDLELQGNTDNTISVTVKPKGEGPLSQPLCLTATAEELDAEFASCVAQYSNARKSLAEQMEATAAVLAAAKSESANKAAKTITKSASASTVKDKAPPEDDDEPEDDTDAKNQASAPTGGSTENPLVGGNLFID